MDDAAELEFVGPQRVHGRLRVVDELRVVAGQPLRQRLRVGGNEGGGIEDEGVDRLRGGIG